MMRTRFIMLPTLVLLVTGRLLLAQGPPEKNPAASGLVFAGDGEGNIMAFETRTGKNLWHYQLGFPMRSTAGTTYMVDGRQYLLVPSGSALTAFALPQKP